MSGFSWSRAVRTAGRDLAGISSTDSAGNQGPEGSYDPSISGDGRYVAFRSTRLLAPTDQFAGLFVKDQTTGSTTMVAQGSHFTDVFSPSLSADGRYLAYDSMSRYVNLAITRVMVKDLVASSTVYADRMAAFPGTSTSRASLSGDARFVAFQREYRSLDQNNPVTTGDVYRDTIPSPPPAQSTLGLYDQDSSLFCLRNSNSAGFADQAVAFGPAAAGWLPIVGDWDDDGVVTVGLYDPLASKFYLSNSNTMPVATTFAFGPPGAGWLPIAGRWSGVGADKVGLYDPKTGTFYLSYANTNPNAESTYAFGAANAGWLPVAGDWDGDGITTIGLYDPAGSTFFLRNSHGTGVADVTFGFGLPGSNWKPIAGDWTGAGSDAIGLYAPDMATVFLRNTNSTGMADNAFGYGAPGGGALPIAGNWVAQGFALVAESGTPKAESGNGDFPAPHQSSLVPLLTTAIARWADARVVITAPEIVWTDLPGAELGRAVGKTIYLDRTAAGFGWFIDPTPNADEEFSAAPGSCSLQALDARAVDRMDLLTVVEHELGHLAGLSDLDVSADSLMSGALRPGVRRAASWLRAS